MHNDQPTTAEVAKHGSISRAFAGVICGVVAGMLIPGALANGCLFYFPEERHANVFALNPSIGANPRSESQRDSIHQPRVGETRLTWETVPTDSSTLKELHPVRRRRDTTP